VVSDFQDLHTRRPERQRHGRLGVGGEERVDIAIGGEQHGGVLVRILAGRARVLRP
jgi:hypothetical protein